MSTTARDERGMGGQEQEGEAKREQGGEELKTEVQGGSHRSSMHDERSGTSKVASVTSSEQRCPPFAALMVHTWPQTWRNLLQQQFDGETFFLCSIGKRGNKRVLQM